METIAIPAFNEAQHIDRLLELLEEEAPPSVVEILVCDNASTDDTARRVGRRVERGERLRLVEAPEPGKPAAWNRLVASAETSVVVFLDADVMPRPGSLARLFAAVAEGGKGSPLAWAGRRCFRPARPGLVPRLTARLADPVLELCLTGACYAIRKEPILARMRARGFDGMPDVFAEDVWLNALLEPGELRLVQDCVVDIELDGFERYLALHARKRLVAAELSEQYPALAGALAASHPEAQYGSAQGRFVLRGDFPLGRKLHWLAAGALKSGVNAVFQRRLEHMVRRYREVYAEHGGSHVLRYVASTSGRTTRRGADAP